MNLSFTKMQGIGNDFVVIDCLSSGAAVSEADLQAASERLCDRKFGIGGDGVLLVLPSEIADFKMRMFNPDSSEAEMCGNGIRCFAKFVRDRGHTQASLISVETGAGVLHVEVSGATPKGETLVKVDLGQPSLDRSTFPMLGGPEPAIGEQVEVAGETVAITAVGMGNPHAIFFVDEATDAVIDRLGPPLEKHSLFPKRINVHAIQVLGPSEIKMMTWERGAGRTLACGTGACASVVASAVNKLTGRRVLVHLPGGDLQIDWADDDRVYMTGAAAEVFTGVIEM